jgi:hypothetical protein
MIDADVRAFKRSGFPKGLETTFYNNMVLKLEYMFEHRQTSVLKVKVGDEVRLSEADFVWLAKTFFTRLAEKNL